MYKRIQYYLCLNKNIIYCLMLASTLVAAIPAQAVPLSNGTLLTITPGVVSGSECISGSCIGVKLTSIITWYPLTPGADGGIIIGKNQASGNQELDALSLSAGDIGVAHNFVTYSLSLATKPLTGDAGNAPTSANLNFFDQVSCSGANCIGKTELGTMNLAWSGYALNFGGDAGGCPDDLAAGINCTVDQDNGIFVSN